jgi:hypothetical protein
LGAIFCQDPIGYSAGDFNLYRYADNNPIHGIDPYGLEANGCGPADWRNGLVPNIPLWIIDFKSACDTHDRCYGKCDAEKEKCDTNFYVDMKVLFNREHEWFAAIPPPAGLAAKQDACDALAWAYHKAVSEFGQGPYDEAQKDSCSNKDK